MHAEGQHIEQIGILDRCQSILFDQIDSNAQLRRFHRGRSNAEVELRQPARSRALHGDGRKLAFGGRARLARSDSSRLCLLLN